MEYQIESTANTEIPQQGPLLQPQTIINGQFQIINHLGVGSFGEVYLGNDLRTGWQVAIKVELPNANPSQLMHEANIVDQFSKMEGFPEIIWSGKDEENRLILVMELLGQNLQQQLNKIGGKMSLKSVLMLIDQMLKRVETLHNKQYLYRDMKPENWMIGKNKGMNTVYLIDFGLVKKYKDKNGKHISYRENKGLIGTARFVSINTHLGMEQSRRDDLEGLGYIWIYLLKGRLPWQGLKADTKEEKYEKLKVKKLQVSIDQLCYKLPQEFTKYMKYCRALKFEEQPDYIQLKTLFKELFFRLYINWDFIWDWIKISENGDQLKNCDCDSQYCHICNDQTQQQAVYSSVHEVSKNDDEVKEITYGSYYLESANKSVSVQENQNSQFYKNSSQNSLKLHIVNDDNNSVTNNNDLSSKKDHSQQDQLQQNNNNQNNQAQSQVPKKLSFFSGFSNPNVNKNKIQLPSNNNTQEQSNNTIDKTNSNPQSQSLQNQQNQIQLTNSNVNNENNLNEKQYQQQQSQQQQNGQQQQQQNGLKLQQQQQQQVPSFGFKQPINFKLCSPNQKNKVNLDKYKNNTKNLFQSIFDQSTEKQQNNNVQNQQQL